MDILWSATNRVCLAHLPQIQNAPKCFRTEWYVFWVGLLLSGLRQCTTVPFDIHPKAQTHSTFPNRVVHDLEFWVTFCLFHDKMPPLLPSLPPLPHTRGPADRAQACHHPSSRLPFSITHWNEWYSALPDPTPPPPGINIASWHPPFLIRLISWHPLHNTLLPPPHPPVSRTPEPSPPKPSFRPPCCRLDLFTAPPVLVPAICRGEVRSFGRARGVDHGVRAAPRLLDLQPRSRSGVRGGTPSVYPQETSRLGSVGFPCSAATVVVYIMSTVCIIWPTSMSTDSIELDRIQNARQAGIVEH